MDYNIPGKCVFKKIQIEQLRYNNKSMGHLL